MKTDLTSWEFDDGSVTTVSDSPEPLPPRDCAERNRTGAEFADMEAHVQVANAGNRGPGDASLPPLPPDRYKGGEVRAK